MRKRNKIISLILAVCMALSMTGSAFAAAYPKELGNFDIVQEYQDDQFADVKPGSWFSSYVATAYRLGIMLGKSDSKFDPSGMVSLAETITVAARLHSIYHTGGCKLENGTPWYKPFVDYAISNGIIRGNEYLDYNRSATRTEYAKILAAAFPDEALPEINQIEDDSIPDVPSTRSYAAVVYKLYRAGILCGSNDERLFLPDKTISRAEVAAILSRLIDVSQRTEFSLEKKHPKTGLNAVEISKKCSDSVFYIEVYDASGYAISTGSGFFIDSSGTAVTNYHVINGAYSAQAILSDGTVKNILGAYAWSEEKDLAILKLEAGQYKPLSFGNGELVSGQTVYAIGSPYGFDNSISQGIIANPKRTMGDMDYIQFTAPISSGSSGGALIDEEGNAIGISSIAFINTDTSTTQNLNLAIPVSYINELEKGELQTFPLKNQQEGSLFIYDQDNIVIDVDAMISSVPVYYYSNDYVTVEYEYIGRAAEYVSCEWNDFDDGFVPLNLYGIKPGAAKVKINLYSQADETLLDSTTISITIAKGFADLTSSDYNPIIIAGSSSKVNIHASANNKSVTCTYYIDDTSVAECSWDEAWNGKDIGLTILGKKAGTTSVYIEMNDEYGTCLDAIYINVAVTGSTQGWKASRIIFNSSYDDDNTNCASISKYDPVYVHFMITGSDSDGQCTIHTVMTYPDGSTETLTLNDPYFDGAVGCVYWSTGIWNDPENCPVGRMMIDFYDDDWTWIGYGVVNITN